MEGSGLVMEYPSVCLGRDRCSGCRQVTKILMLVCWCWWLSKKKEKVKVKFTYMQCSSAPATPHYSSTFQIYLQSSKCPSISHFGSERGGGGEASKWHAIFGCNRIWWSLKAAGQSSHSCLCVREGCGGGRSSKQHLHLAYGCEGGASCDGGQSECRTATRN